jgi:hypothetical protein
MRETLTQVNEWRQSMRGHVETTARKGDVLVMGVAGSGGGVLDS